MKDSLLTKECQSYCIPTRIRKQQNPYLELYTKFHSKWIKGINVRLDTLNLIKKKVAKILEFTGKGKTLVQETGTADIKTKN